MNLITTTTYLGISAVYGGSFLLFIDYFERERISANRLALIIGYLVLVYSWEVSWLYNYLYYFFAGEPQPTGYNAGYFNLLSLIILSFFILIAVLCSRVLQHMKQFALDTAHRKQLSYMQWAILSIFLFAPLLSLSQMFFGYIGVNVDLEYPGFVCIFVGIGLLWLAYARTTRVALLQPQQIDKILVLNEGGVLLYSYEFSHTPQTINDMLISGGLTAVRGIMREAMGTGTELRSITFEDKEIMFITLGRFGFVLFAGRKSRFLQAALENFGKAFSNKYEAQIERIVNLDAFNESKGLIEKAFGLAR